MIEQVELKRIKILNSEILLEDLGEGKGKIIVNTPFGNYSHYWGAMGEDLLSFVKSIDCCYFAGRLCTKPYTFSGKRTAKNIRRYIRTNMSYDLPYYRYMPVLKELRKLVKRIEYAKSQSEALSLIEDLYKNYNYYELSYEEEKEFLSVLEDHFSQEPWHFLEEDFSREYKFLLKLHKNLVKIL